MEAELSIKLSAFSSVILLVSSSICSIELSKLKRGQQTNA